MTDLEQRLTKRLRRRDAEIVRLNEVLSELGELARLRSLPLMQAVLAKHFETNKS